MVGTIDGTADDLKITQIGDDFYGIVFSAMANPDGTIYNDTKRPETYTSAKLYRSLFVRHWDTYIRPQRKTIFYAALLKATDSAGMKAERLTMSNPVNALKRTGLESPVPPDGGSNDFDVSKKGIIFVAKDPDLDPALHTKRNIYLVPLENFLETTPAIYSVNMDEFRGAMTSPSFSADSMMVAFLAMKEDGYEDDMRHVFLMPDIRRPSWVLQLLTKVDNRTDSRWDRNPKSVKWSADGGTLFLTAEDQGRELLFALPSDPTDNDSLPQPLTHEASVSSFQPLASGKIFVSKTSLIDPSIYSLIDISDNATQIISSLSSNGAKLNLYPSQITSTLFQGSPNTPAIQGLIHAWIIKPSTFDPSHTYPLALLVHGGPQGAWTDSWSTRWNPAVFAEQGYVVVCPNITGSTGYGQAFEDAICRQWGGLPYQDFESCFAHLETIPWIDTSRAVALGASYGGYMMNWMQGQPLGRRFRALVCHDGVFSTRFELASDELYFINHEFGGEWRPSDEESRRDWQRWDPSLNTDYWATPELVIHSEKDYRLTMADGLATFNVLQSKGVESEFLTFEEENHFVLRQENSLRWHRVVLDFCNRHVGLPVEEVESGIVMDPEVDAEDDKEGRARVQVFEREE